MSGMENKLLVVGLVAALAVCTAASADPPARVGRLNLIQGSVSFKPGDMDEWTAATLNYPLTAGDSLWTGAFSRAEVHVGSTAIRLAAGTESGFLELDDQAVRISLQQGLLNVRLRDLEPGESLDIDTPTMNVSLVAAGSYRIEVGDSGDARATVTEGRAEVAAGSQAYPISEGQTAFVTESDWPYVGIREAPAEDEWDQWCAARDNREDHLASVRYVPRTMVGCEDLDRYGSWSVSVEFGPVWTPTPKLLPVGWAPYRYGHWAWVRPWGWTWIDDLAWGFAPFHYGRWALVHGVWVWVPGSNAHRPVYAPALVVFIEAGAVANGRIGWFPLGPGEAYAPPYTVSQAYLKRVNMTHVKIGDQEKLDVSRIQYAHRDLPHATTVVARQSFSRARPVGDSRVAIADRELSQARVIGTTTRVAPERDGVPAAAAKKQREVARQKLIVHPEVRAPEPKAKTQKPQISQKRQKVLKKKRLAGGKWVWVEEWVSARE